MSFANHDYVVQAFPSNRANHPLGIRVLPRRAGRNYHFAEVQCLGLARKSLSIHLVSVADQIPWRLFVHAGLQQLPRRPTQKIRSISVSRGREWPAFHTASCCRSARFSSANSRCVRAADSSVPRTIPSHLNMAAE